MKTITTRDVIDQFKEDIADALYNMVTKQTFEDFYRGEFEDHVVGEPDCWSESDIKRELFRQFKDSCI